MRAGVYRREAVPSEWPEPPVPQPDDVAAGVALVASIGTGSPLLRSEELSARFGRNVFLKIETGSPVGSFKHRGALVAVDRIARETTARTVVTASTGNHGQGIAYAATRRGLKAIVYAPEGAVDRKLDAMRALGATVEIHGVDLGEAQHAASLAADKETIYIEDGESPDLMAGAASVAWEIIDDPVEVDTVVIPTGGGNLIGGSLLSRAHRHADFDIVGVQSTAASGATQSWLSGEKVESPCTTFAGGLATTRPGEMALAVMVSYLDTMILVDDADIYSAIGLMSRSGGIDLEGAAAASVAAMMQFGEVIPGDPIALVLTGRWYGEEELARGIRSFENYS